VAAPVEVEVEVEVAAEALEDEVDVVVEFPESIPISTKWYTL
jgi:hypothetical protein